MDNAPTTAHAMQVGHLLNMVAELPGYVADATLPLAVRTACIESHVMHVRAAWEFFFGGRDKRDIHRHDFLPGWSPSDTFKTELRNQHTFASQQVAHLSKDRIDESGSGVTNLPPGRQWSLTWLILDLTRQFVTALHAAGSAHATLFDGYLTDATRRANVAYSRSPLTRGPSDA